MRKAGLIMGLAAALLAGPSVSQQVQYDTSGKGAVLCAQLMLMEVRYASQLCRWARTPADDAIDTAITRIDSFVLANSSRPVTQDMLDQQKRDYFASRPQPGAEPAPRCAADPTTLDSDMQFLWRLHDADPAIVDAWMDDLLSVPREPLINPCF